MNGVAVEESLLEWVKRVNRENVSTVLAGSQTMLKVAFTTDSTQTPHAIDYLNLAGRTRVKSSKGFCLRQRFAENLRRGAGSGAARRVSFGKGDGRTYYGVEKSAAERGTALSGRT